MSPGAFTRGVAERLSGISRQQLVLRCGIGVGAVGVLAVILIAGGTLSPFWTSFVVLAALVTMLIPQDFAPFVLLTGLIWLWAISVPDLFSPATILVAALLFGIHVLCALTSYGPPELVLDRAILVRWLSRCTWGAAAAGATWSAVWLTSSVQLSGGEWVRVVALGLLLVWIGFLTSRLLRPAS